MTREEAIQVLQTALTSPFIYGEYADAIGMAIEALQADYSKILKTTLNGDLISRADAIDALGDEPEVWNDTDAEWAERDSWVLHKVAIESLPSAEAVEIVRCKDCKHRDLFSCPLTDNDFQKDDDYCSWGQRKGGDDE